MLCFMRVPFLRAVFLYQWEFECFKLNLAARRTILWSLIWWWSLSLESLINFGSGECPCGRLDWPAARKLLDDFWQGALFVLLHTHLQSGHSSVWNVKCLRLSPNGKSSRSYGRIRFVWSLRSASFTGLILIFLKRIKVHKWCRSFKSKQNSVMACCYMYARTYYQDVMATIMNPILWTQENMLYPWKSAISSWGPVGKRWYFLQIPETFLKLYQYIIMHYILSRTEYTCTVRSIYRCFPTFS